MARGKHSQEHQLYVHTAINTLLCPDVLEICLTIMWEQLLSWSPWAIKRTSPPFNEHKIICHLWMCSITKQSYMDMFHPYTQRSNEQSFAQWVLSVGTIPSGSVILPTLQSTVMLPTMTKCCAWSLPSSRQKSNKQCCYLHKNYGSYHHHIWCDSVQSIWFGVTVSNSYDLVWQEMS